MKVGIAEETSLREDLINKEFESDTEYNPYSKDISFYNNTWSFGSFRKKLQTKDGAMVTLGLMGKDAHIWYDGVENPDGSTICINENVPMKVANLDMLNDYKALRIETSGYRCDDQQSLSSSL